MFARGRPSSKGQCSFYKVSSENHDICFLKNAKKLITAFILPSPSYVPMLCTKTLALQCQNF